MQLNEEKKKENCKFQVVAVAMDAPHRHWQNTWKKSLMGTTQGSYVLFWTNPGSSTPQNSSCTATYLPSQKPSK